MIKQLLKFGFNPAVLLMFAFSLYTPLAVAASYQSHKSIYKTAKSYIETQVLSDSMMDSLVKLGNLDSRLKIKKCNQRLTAFMPKGSRNLGKTTVGVKCAGTNPWTLHVPATISIYKNVLVAAHLLQKGSVLSAEDTKLKRLDISTLPYGYIEKIKNGTGMKLKRRVLTDKVLTPSMLKRPRIISRGQQVTIMAQLGRMKVRMKGKALANGAVGERIRVINLKSEQKLEGVINSAGEVEIDI